MMCLVDEHLSRGRQPASGELRRVLTGMGPRSGFCPINTFYDGVTGGLTLGEVLSQAHGEPKAKYIWAGTQRHLNGITMSTTHP